MGVIMDNSIVRIHKITFHNFKNVEFGSIDFACSKKNEQQTVDIMGLYGQNGSGKTALIDALAILKTILTGRSLSDDCVNYITLGKQSAQIVYVFEIKSETENFKVEYGFDLVREKANSESNIESPESVIRYRAAIANEALSMSGIVSGHKFKMQPLINTASPDSPFIPNTKMNEIMGRDKDLRNKLMVNKQLAKEKSQSFIFLKETLHAIKDNCKVAEYLFVINALVQYGNFYLYVVDTKSTGLINLNAALPFFFRFDNEKSLSTGSIAIKLEGSSIVSTQICNIIQKAISNMNTVLEQLVPGLNVRLENLGFTLLPDKTDGCTVELVSIRNGNVLPLRYESEGIKKIISVLQLLIAMFNIEGITVAIDELDAGVFEYLLGELLKIISESGKGQLIFTSHNLRPLETIDKKFIFFTTTNPKNRYIQLENVQTNNNMRYFYYRDIALGGQKEELYDPTNNYELALSFKEAGEFDDF